MSLSVTNDIEAFIATSENDADGSVKNIVLEVQAPGAGEANNDSISQNQARLIQVNFCRLHRSRQVYFVYLFIVYHRYLNVIPIPMAFDLSTQNYA